MRTTFRIIIPLVALGAYAAWSVWSYQRARLDAPTPAADASGEVRAPDGAARYIVFRPKEGAFYIWRDGSPSTLRLGLKQGTPVVGDFDGDRHLDYGMYAAGRWTIQPTGKPVSDRLVLDFGGEPDDVALSGADFDGDGRDELVLYRRGTWYVARAASPPVVVAEYRFGGTDADRPVVLRAARGPSLALLREGAWYLDRDRDGTADETFQFGAAGDRPVAIDDDGSAKAGLYRNGLWLVDDDGDRRPDRTIPFGARDDVPLGAFRLERAGR